MIRFLKRLTLTVLLVMSVMGMIEPAAADGTASVVPEYQSFSELAGKQVSMLTGAPFEELVRSKVPDVGEFSYYNTMADMLLALQTGKTDAILLNNAVTQLVVNRNPEFTQFPESLQDGVFGLAFAKGDANRDVWQSAYDSVPKEALQAAWEKWTGSDDSLKVMPEQERPQAPAAKNTRMTMRRDAHGDAVSLLGYGMMRLPTAQKLDVHVEFEGMEFSAVMSYVQSGKALLGAGSIIATKERKESVDFVEYWPASFVLIVRGIQKPEGGSGAPGLPGETESDASGGAGQGALKEQTPDKSFGAYIRDSFEKTFIREERWRLFIDGTLITLLITMLSVLCGTVLGFGVFMMCRNGNRAANLITRFCLWLVQGMPMVVLLMVLYYIVFGNVVVSGIVVAVIGFTLTFGASVYGLLKMGVGAVDRGQYEAAYSQGYSGHRTFFRIILPQALPHVLPAYKGEIVGLIKATSIVGYIAVQDLTKMGDIIRSRTYEAFFPLIAVTIIYFVLEGAIGFAVNRISISFDPKRRSRERILKGVKTSD